MAKLALNGGTPILKEQAIYPFPVIDQSDRDAVMECFDNNSFSEFRAGMMDGGKKVKEFEHVVKESVGSYYSVSFDTWSNGIYSCLLACGVKPGDKVIVSPYTMTSCAASILACGAIPVFVDLNKTDLSFDMYDLERKYDKDVKAMIVVHLFGIPSNMRDIMIFAEQHNVRVIEDCAQAPKAKYGNEYCGTFGDVGGFSLTQSKHVMSGEGGIAVTNSDKINKHLRIIRNHGEVLSDNDCDLYGFNFRMTEMTAALAANQWKKLDHVLKLKADMVDLLSSVVRKYRFLRLFEPEYECTPSWYVFPFRFISELAGIRRCSFASALLSEGFGFFEGYSEPLYRQNIYKLRGLNYDICFNVEDMYFNELLYTLDIRLPYDMKYIEKMCEALQKVCDNIDELHDYDKYTKEY